MNRWTHFTLRELGALARALEGLANISATETRALALDLRTELITAVSHITEEAK